jgi:prepilin-type N-terminal cleavage/methylation domain-containing protein
MRHGRQGGFTLVEIIVAIFVGGIIIGSVNLVLINQTYLSQRNKDLVLANAFVEGKIEALRSAGYSTLVDGTTNISAELPAGLTKPNSGSLVISSVNTGTKKIDVTVTYNEQGSARDYSYSTFVGELGVGQY